MRSNKYFDLETMSCVSLGLSISALVVSIISLIVSLVL